MWKKNRLCDGIGKKLADFSLKTTIKLDKVIKNNHFKGLTNQPKKLRSIYSWKTAALLLETFPDPQWGSRAASVELLIKTSSLPARLTDLIQKAKSPHPVVLLLRVTNLTGNGWAEKIYSLTGLKLALFQGSGRPADCIIFICC